MAEGTNFDMGEEFAGLDFNSERLEKRFRRTMKTLAKQPGESIRACNANRAESVETKFPSDIQHAGERTV
jgi:hypothetical protein